jgi:hypothetical protein
MPSPFPGMDPYLEHPAVFPDLHDRLITNLSETLQSGLPDPYFAAIGDRVWVEVSEREIGPDVKVLRGREERSFEGSRGGGTSVAAAPRSLPIVVTVPQDERREPFLEIRSRVEGERLVTIVEVLSLANKTPGAQGRDLYLRKQKEILESRTPGASQATPPAVPHLVEIDLLRAGEHATAVPLERALRKTGRFDYHACVHRFDSIEDYFVYPILLRQKLPEVAIPLLPGDAPVTVDLQAVFDRCYDTGPYSRRVRYGEVEPEPPLPEQDREWARGIIGGGRPGR